MSYSGGKSKRRANLELSAMSTSSGDVYFQERDTSASPGGGRALSNGEARVRYGDRAMAEAAESALAWRKKHGGLKRR